MNQNDILSQQQALMNQMAAHSDRIVWGMIIIQILLFFLGAWVLYMFYCRLRDISIEIKNFRLTYESLNPSRTKPSSVPRSEPPPSSHSESRYMPKP
jgi:hypothetical protein